MDMLARREHSSRELEQKLLQRFPGQLLMVRSVLSLLTEDGLQSDGRFAASYCRSRISRGFGAERIFRELLQKGVSEEEAKSAIDDQGVDWNGLMSREFRKKCHGEAPESAAEKGRYMRFLHRRGFPASQVRRLVGSGSAGDE